MREMLGVQYLGAYDLKLEKEGPKNEPLGVTSDEWTY